MHCKTKLNLKIVLIPSYIDAVLRSSPNINYESVLKFGELKSILFEQDVLIFLLVQDQLNKLTHNVFCDIPGIDYMSQQTLDPAEQRQWDEAKSALYERISLDASIAERKPKDVDDAGPLIKDDPSLFGEEYYVPRMLNGDTLLLVGATTPQYKTPRAFMNAVIEELAAGGIRYTDFKQLEVFRNYLKHAIDD